MPEERPRGRPRTIDRAKAVQSAMRSWWAEGIEAVSLNEISRRTGLSKSSLYREFGGEDGLMAAALEQYRALSAMPLLELFEHPLEPRDLLALVVQATTTDHGLPPGCFFTKLRLRRATLGEATRSKVRQMVNERLAVFETWYSAVSQRGLNAPNLSARQAARYLDAQLTLLLVRLSAGDQPEQIREDANLALGALLASPPLGRTSTRRPPMTRWMSAVGLATGCFAVSPQSASESIGASLLSEVDGTTVRHAVLHIDAPKKGMSETWAAGIADTETGAPHDARHAVRCGQHWQALRGRHGVRPHRRRHPGPRRSGHQVGTRNDAARPSCAWWRRRIRCHHAPHADGAQIRPARLLRHRDAPLERRRQGTTRSLGGRTRAHLESRTAAGLRATALRTIRCARRRVPVFRLELRPARTRHRGRHRHALSPGSSRTGDR